MSLKIRLILCLFILASITFAQDNSIYIDSLKKELNNPNHHDTTKINILFKLVENIYDDSVWPDYNEKAYQLALKLSESKDEKIKYFALKAQADVYNNRGYLQKILGNTKQALHDYLKALKFAESIKHIYGAASSSINIGTLLAQQKQYDEALKYYLTSIRLADELNDKNLKAIAFQSIAGIYTHKNHYDSAKVYLFKSLDFFKEQNNSNSIAEIYNGIAVLYFKEFKADSSLFYHQKALELFKKTDNYRHLSNTYYNFAKIYYDKKNETYLIKALHYLDSAFHYSFKINYYESYADLYHLKSDIYYNLSLLSHKSLNQKYELLNTAFESFKLFKVYTDSIYNKEVLDNTIKQQLKYEFDRKQTQLKLEQEKKESILKAEKKRQQLFLILLSAIAFSITIIAFIIYKSLKQTKKQKEIIEQQKQIVEEKQKEILDSIHYAKRIQTALLTSEFYIEKQLNRLKKLL